MQDLHQSVQQVLGSIGVTGSFSLQSVSGGDIHQAFLISIGNKKFFLKVNAVQYSGVLQSEYASLQQLCDLYPSAYPKPIKFFEIEHESMLLMEWMNLTVHNQESAHHLGEKLAIQHRIEHENYGWFADNYIGLTLQKNEWQLNWGDFYKEQRLLPQLELAKANGASKQLLLSSDLLLDRLEQNLLPRDYRPVKSLLHGDFWSGNTAKLDDGTAVLFDPAPYFGDRETDLAMTELFGGFAPEFYAAYQANYPLEPEYQQRKKLYQLYHVLNHFNLFGSGYESQAISLVGQCLAS